MAKLIHLLKAASANTSLGVIPSANPADLAISQQVKDLVTRANAIVTPVIPARSSADDITKIKYGAVLALALTEGHT